jgi:hypothetical protein
MLRPRFAELCRMSAFDPRSSRGFQFSPRRSSFDRILTRHLRRQYPGSEIRVCGGGAFQQVTLPVAISAQLIELALAAPASEAIH